MSDAVQKIQELLKLPQSLCNMCGKCCYVATFRGGKSYQEIIDLIKNPESNPIDVEGAIDFLTIFEPYEDHDTVKILEPEFYERVMKKIGNPNTSFFICRFIGKNGGCMIHEDRPFLCRVYPVPHETTMFIPGCGFENQCVANWEEIKKIVLEVEERAAARTKLKPEE
jgi:Fe-S-cluster containining protein